MAIKEIRIEFVDPERKPHIFRLGLGPCGRVVESLAVHRDDAEFSVMQMADGQATFAYPLRNVLRVAMYSYDPGVCPLEV